MEIVSNEQKAKEICDCDNCKACSKFADEGAAYAFVSTCDRFDELMQAMLWRDEKHKQEKQQQIIDRACEFFYDKLNGGDMECGDIEKFIEDFKKVVK